MNVPKEFMEILTQRDGLETTEANNQDGRASLDTEASKQKEIAERVMSEDRDALRTLANKPPPTVPDAD